MLKSLLNSTAIWVSAAAATVTAVAGGIATRLGPWYYNLRKPRWQPPDWVFGPAWTMIFGFIAAAGALAWRDAKTPAQRALVLGLWGFNYVLNFLWSVLFFTLRRPDWAEIEVVALWGSIVAMIAGMRPFARPASLLLLPYLAWVSFAAFLNRAVVRLNGPFPSPALAA